MTDEQWLACVDPSKMLDFLGSKLSARKQRLFACACCRGIWHLLMQEGSRRAVEAVERHADGSDGDEALRPAHEAGTAAFDEASVASDDLAVHNAASAARFVALPEFVPRTASYVAQCVRSALAPAFHHAQWHGAGGRIPRAARQAEAVAMAAQSRLFRDLVANPFRPTSVDPAWLTPTVVSLAQAAYDERILPSGELDPARLSVLADALEEAGCTNGAILDHLRSAGPHVRGCWALDLVLGKE